MLTLIPVQFTAKYEGLFVSLGRVLECMSRLVIIELICRVTKYDHATPCLLKLHWLPIRERINFKILMYIYKCLNGTAPTYLTSSLSLYRSTRTGLYPKHH